MHELRVAFRSLAKSPGFTFAALATLTLAVGATAAVYSIARAVLLEPLPYREPERIVRFIGSKEGETQSRYDAVSYPDLRDAVAQSGVFESAAAYDEWSPSLMGTGEAEVLRGAAVDSAFFHVLGVRAARGRFFVAREDVPGNDTTVVISHGLWRRKFGAREDIAGHAIRVDRRMLTVAGVTAPDFRHPYLSDDTEPVEIWTTLAVDASTNQAPRSGRSFTGIARLKRGVTVEQAAAAVGTVAKRLERAYPESHTGRGMTVVPLHARITRNVQKPIWLFFAAVLLLLLMACVNVANLMLARVSSRNADLLVRSALGARPWHLFVPLFAETLVLGVGGAALGLGLAYAATQWIARLAADALPRVDAIAIDVPVILFALGTGVIAALLVAATPAIRQWRGWQAIQLRGRGASEDVSTLSAHASLVIVQVALSVVLLTAAALVARSLWNLLSVDSGIDGRGAYVFGVRAPASAYPELDDVPRFYSELDRRLGELPGVEAAGVTSILPFDGDFNGMLFHIDGRPTPRPGEELSAEQRTVTPGFFAAIGIPIVAGRAFTPNDDADAPPVVIVDEAFARLHFQGESPIGRRITAFDRSNEIVGVARAARIMSLGEPAVPTFYAPWAQLANRRSASVVVRTSASPATIIPAVRATVRAISPDAPVMHPRPLRDVVGKSLGAQKLRTTLLSMFGVAALLLAAVGVAGVLATNVARRRREIGVRMAMGATEREIAAFIVGRGMRLVAAGLAAGALLSLLTNRVLQTMLFGVGAADPVSLIAVAALLALAGLLAAAIPAWRAAATDPATVMRAE
ncbi:MAG TPA: ABC transporter permease [Thermoanaerobaculia bacterium]|nr:ABC transporter permease [Thermoanaerobaculia bacterium]